MWRDRGRRELRSLMVVVKGAERVWETIASGRGEEKEWGGARAPTTNQPIPGARSNNFMITNSPLAITSLVPAILICICEREILRWQGRHGKEKYMFINTMRYNFVVLNISTTSSLTDGDSESN